MQEEGGQALIMAARNLRAIYAQSTRTSTVAVAFLGFFLAARILRADLIPHRCAPTSVRIPHRPARTCAQSTRSLRAVYAQSTRSLRAVYAQSTRIPHRPSTPLTDLHRYCVMLVYAQSTRSLRAVYAQSTRIPHSLRAVCAQPSPMCAQPVCAQSARTAHRWRWHFYPLSVKVRVDCA